jgi:hypothetical protein
MANPGKQLTHELGISFETAMSPRAHILEKLVVHDTVSAMRWAIRVDRSARKSPDWNFGLKKMQLFRWLGGATPWNVQNVLSCLK